MGIEFNPAIKGKDGGKTQGAFLADNSSKKMKFDEQIAAAYNGANGYVSPPASNIMGFGPASNSA